MWNGPPRGWPRQPSQAGFGAGSGGGGAGAVGGEVPLAERKGALGGDAPDDDEPTEFFLEAVEGEKDGFVVGEGHEDSGTVGDVETFRDESVADFGAVAEGDEVEEGGEEGVGDDVAGGEGGVGESGEDGEGGAEGGGA